MAEDDRDEEIYLYMGGPEEIVPLDVKYVSISSPFTIEDCD